VEQVERARSFQDALQSGRRRSHGFQMRGALAET
jgi:hypothetical protein